VEAYAEVTGDELGEVDAFAELVSLAVAKDPRLAAAGAHALAGAASRGAAASAVGKQSCCHTRAAVHRGPAFSLGGAWQSWSQSMGQTQGSFPSECLDLVTTVLALQLCMSWLTLVAAARLQQKARSVGQTLEGTRALAGSAAGHGSQGATRARRPAAGGAAGREQAAVAAPARVAGRAL